MSVTHIPLSVSGVSLHPLLLDTLFVLSPRADYTRMVVCKLAKIEDM